MRIRCLSVHAPYRCAHAGACCEAGWTIPIEEHLVAPLALVGIAVAAERVAPTRPGGACAFFEAEAGRLCTIQRRGGAALLPSMCRHFPRVIVNDPRGTSVTLSHFCPTAANLLFEETTLTIVEAPANVALVTFGGRLEGLDATDVLPPLLAPGVLTDWDGYDAWEENAVALFGTPGLLPAAAVDALLRATDAVCRWTPGTEPLASAVHRAFAIAAESGGRRGEDVDWTPFAAPVNAFLAAHAYASWSAYEPDGLRCVAAAVAHALAVLRESLDGRRPTKDVLVEAIRAADLRLRHSTAPRAPHAHAGA